MLNRERLLRLLLLLSVLPGLLLAPGCTPDAADSVQAGAAAPPVGSKAQELTMLGVERVIPVRFYLLMVSGDTECSDLPGGPELHRALHEANAVFLPAGVQFSFQRVTTYTSPHFAKPRKDDALNYQAVRSELKALDPTWDEPTRSDTKTSYAWLQELLVRLPHTRLNIISTCKLPGSGAPHAAYPPHYTIFFTHTSLEGSPRVQYAHNNSTLAHELGHYLGLPHTFEENPLDLAAWDMVYGIGGGAVRFFASRSERAAFTGSVKLMENNLIGGDCGRYINPLTCEMKCNIEGTDYLATDMRVRSILFRDPSTGKYGTNVMAYMHTDDNCAHHLSASQIERVRATLRSSAGDRWLLGRQTFAPKSRFLDFDGDGKRDIAYFRYSDRSCHVRKSSNGAELILAVTEADATYGDVPVPGDFDGDGRTDCAVFRPGAATRWFWTSSATYASGSSTFGELGDIPLPGVRMKSEAAGYGLYAVYRPSTGQTWWQTRAGLAVAKSFDAGPASELVFDDYDGDGYTDIALWNPQAAGGGSTQAKFYVLGSRGSYGTLISYVYGETGDIPLGAVKRDNNATKDFALFRPSTGMWYYLMNPSEASYVPASQRFGVSGDIPLAGYDFDGDGLHDEVVYRPGESAFYIDVGATIRVNVGLGGDIPFLAPDRSGDGRPELWLHRPTGQPEGNYFEIPSSGGYSTYTPSRFGNYSEDVPLN